MKDFHVRRGAHWMVISLFLAVTGCGGDYGLSVGVVLSEAFTLGIKAGVPPETLFEPCIDSRDLKKAG